MSAPHRTTKRETANRNIVSLIGIRHAVRIAFTKISAGLHWAGLGAAGRRLKLGDRAGRAGDTLFILVLGGLFLLSLIPFWLSPSLILTFSLSLPPFILIYLRAEWRRKSIVVEIRDEEKCLESFLYNGEVFWRQLRESPTHAISEQDILALVSDKIRAPAFHSKALIEDIAKGKTYLIDAPRDSILQPFQDDFEYRYKEATSFANLSTKLGILGTFCGFIFALITLSNFFGNLNVGEQYGPATGSAAIDPGGSTEFIRTTLQNLAYAFVKSVYGLAVAMVITIQISELRKPIDRVYRLVDDTLSFAREFVNRMTFADPAIHASLVQVRNALRDVHQRLFDHSSVVSDSLRQQGMLIGEHTRVFADAAKGIVEVQRGWEGAFNNLNGAARAFDLRTSGALDLIDSRLFSAATKVDEMLQALGHTRGELSGTSQSLIEIVGTWDAQWAKRLDTLSKESANRDAKFAAWANTVDAAFGAIRRQMDMLETGLTASQAGFESNATSTQNLSKAVERLAEALQGNAIRRPIHRMWRAGVALLGLGTALLIWDFYVANDPLHLEHLEQNAKHQFLGSILF